MNIDELLVARIPSDLLDLLRLGLVTDFGDFGFSHRARQIEYLVQWYEDMTAVLGEPAVRMLAEHYSMSQIEAISSIVRMYRHDQAIEEWSTLTEFCPPRAVVNRHARRKHAKIMKGRR